MNDLIKRLKAYVEENRERLIDELTAFLAQPSVSTTGLGIEETVVLLREHLEKLGFETRLLTLPGAYPVVFGQAGPKEAASLTVYGHYDVQDPDPLSEWDSDPFKPQIREGRLYARGATDDKGNLWANIKAAQALMEVTGGLPLRLKLFFEGEEEIGSPNLRTYLQEYSSLLSSRATILCDRGVHESGRPQIYLGDKGMVSVRVRARRAKRDVHSGHAPLIPSSAWDLVRFLGTIKDEQGRILIPGYLDEVSPPDEEELELIRTVPFDPVQFRERYGIAAPLVSGTPEKMLTALLYQPTANISGLRSGWTGEKPKTIIPAASEAILDFRLVKGQESARAAEKIERFASESPWGPFELDIQPHFEEYRCPPSDPWARLAMDTARAATGRDPVVWPLLDGSGPLCWFHRYLGGPTFIIGLGSPFETANTHAPNENIGLDQYLTGIVQMAALLYQGAGLGR